MTAKRKRGNAARLDEAPGTASGGSGAGCWLGGGIGCWLGGALGVAFCLAVLTPGVIDPANAGWPMSGGDVTQHLLGWMFYRQEPWRWPIGVVCSYGAPIPTSIVYTDSIPLLAVVFKLLRGLLPPVFQYIGLWALCCYALQGVFGALLMRAIGGDLFVQLAGSAFFVLSPIMFYRLTFGHDALAGHWLVLAGLWLNVRPAATGRRVRPWREASAWGLLVNLALWIHPYLWGMVLALGLARAAQATFLDRLWKWRHAAALAASAIAGLAIFYWLMGLGQVGADAGGVGFGESSMNLNALVNPLGRSMFLPDLPIFNAQQEGFNYLGLGVIVLAVAAAALLASRPPKRATLRRHAALGVCCAGLLALALSNRVAWGQHLLFVVPLGPLARACAIFRASGRFFWPVYYLILCASIRLAVSRVHKPLARAILLLTLLLQGLDLWGSIAAGHARFAEVASWRDPLRGPFWEQVARRYDKIVVVPASHREADYANLGFFAATRGMTINVAYLARRDQAALDAYQRRLMRDVEAGALDPRAFYVTRRKEIAAIIRKRLPPGEKIVFVDGHYIRAPGRPSGAPSPNAQFHH